MSNRDTTIVLEGKLTFGYFCKPVKMLLLKLYFITIVNMHGNCANVHLVISLWSFVLFQ